jgi:hypothetical protein
VAFGAGDNVGAVGELAEVEVETLCPCEVICDEVATWPSATMVPVPGPEPDQVTLADPVSEPVATFQYTTAVKSLRTDDPESSNAHPDPDGADIVAGVPFAADSTNTWPEERPVGYGIARDVPLLVEAEVGVPATGVLVILGCPPYLR